MQLPTGTLRSDPRSLFHQACALANAASATATTSSSSSTRHHKVNNNLNNNNLNNNLNNNNLNNNLNNNHDKQERDEADTAGQRDEADEDKAGEGAGVAPITVTATTPPRGSSTTQGECTPTSPRVLASPVRSGGSGGGGGGGGGAMAKLAALARDKGLSKRAKFEWFVCFGAEHHVLHVWFDLVSQQQRS